MSIIPLDFLDDDENSYVTNLAPSLDDDELQDFPINLGSLDVTKIPLQVITPKQWTGIIKLIDPMHLLGVYQLFSLAITKTWEYEMRCAVDDARHTAALSTTDGTAPTQIPTYPKNHNPPITMETYPDSVEGQYMTFPMTEILTAQILPLFGMMVMKVHWKADQSGAKERYEYRFRFGAKALRVMDGIALMGDINHILALDDAIQIEDIANRLFLSTLTTMLKRNAFVVVPKDRDNDDNDDDNDDANNTIPAPEDYSQLWYEMSQFDIMINYATKPLLGDDNNNAAPSLSPTPKTIQQVDFQSSESMYNYFKSRTSCFCVDVLNSVVINYDKSVVLLTVPCQPYSLPICAPVAAAPVVTTKTKQAAAQKAAAVAKQAAAAKKGPQSVTPKPATTTTTTTIVAPLQPTQSAILPLHADLFALLPNILISIVKAIVTFKIKKAQSDHQKLTQAMSAAANNGSVQPGAATVMQRDETKDGLMPLSTIHKFASLFQFLMKNRAEYTPNALISTWLLLTEENSAEGQQELLTKEFNKMVITPKCLQRPPTEVTPSNDHDSTPIESMMESLTIDNDQTTQQLPEDEPDFDSLALSVSISLASSYVHHGFAHGNKVFEALFDQFQKEQLTKQ